MASVRNNSWWDEFLQRLQTESLTDLAAAYQVGAAALEAGLGQADLQGPASEAPWWPEALRRIEGGESLRATASAFGTNPRRLQRGLSRAGVAVAGQETGAAGEPDLSAMPSKATRTELPPVAQLVPVLPPARVEATSVGGSSEWEDSEPRPEARPERRPWTRPEILEPQVIRRPTSSNRAAGRDLPPLGVPRSAEGAEGSVGGSWSATDGEILDVAPRSGSEGRGRRRIIRRDDAIREEPALVEEPTRTRRRQPSPHGEVRIVESRRRSAAKAATPPATALGSAPDSVTRPLGRAPSVASRAASAAPVTSPPRVEAPPVALTPSVAPLPVSTSTHRSSPAGLPWRVKVGDELQAFLVVAPTVLDAVRLVAGRLPASALPRVSVYLAGTLLR